MGYTHYWSKSKIVDETSYAAALKDIAKIVKSQAKILANASGDEGTRPKTTGGISFNGIGKDSYESFILPKNPTELNRDFCKTAVRPYDKVVVASLARLAEVEGISVASDGNADDWKEGVALASKILGRAIKNPLGHSLTLVKSFVTSKYKSQIESKYKIYYTDRSSKC